MQPRLSFLEPKKKKSSKKIKRTKKYIFFFFFLSHGSCVLQEVSLAWNQSLSKVIMAAKIEENGILALKEGLKEDIRNNLETCLRKRNQTKWKKKYQLNAETLLTEIKKAWPEEVIKKFPFLFYCKPFFSVFLSNL
jgi:hypothetical protein